MSQLLLLASNPPVHPGHHPGISWLHAEWRHYFSLPSAFLLQTPQQVRGCHGDAPGPVSACLPKVALLDIRPESAAVQREGKLVTVHPQQVQVGETIQVKPGEKVPLDGEMLSKKGSFNTSALTGESKPATYQEGEKVLAGMVNLDRLIELKVSKPFNESSLARIL